MQVHCKYDELVDVRLLKPYPKNRNQHTKEQIERLAKLLEYQGIRAPIVVANEPYNCIVKGHGTLSAIKHNKWTEAPVVYQDFENEDQLYAYVQSDNSIASWADLDLSGINSDLGNLGPDFDIDLLGIKDFVIEPADKYGDEDDVPTTPKNAITRMGDLYNLGSHRLLCGDSTDSTQVQRLMNDEKADMVFTDPPYGVSYADKNAFLNALSRGNHIQKRIENDHEDLEGMKKIWDGFLSTTAEACHDKASYYICSPQGGELMMMMMMMIAISDSPWKLKHTIIWVKNNHVLGRADYNYKHEPILYGWKKAGTHEFLGHGRCHTSVWDFDKPLKNDLHPTMKPIAIMEEAIANSCPSNGLVIDTFLGSGSTLIACEKTNRKCYGMEIDPLYCDVIIERWEKFTGKKAEKIG